jgi:hypothetical protein
MTTVKKELSIQEKIQKAKAEYGDEKWQEWQST